MARYRKIDTRIWNDEKFRAFSDDAQLAFFFVLTHPSMTALGAMRATIAGLAAEKGWQVGRFADAIRDAIREGMLEVNEKACFIAARNFLLQNRWLIGETMATIKRARYRFVVKEGPTFMREVREGVLEPVSDACMIRRSQATC